MSQQPYDRLHSLSQPGHILTVAELRHEHKQERAVHIFERRVIVVDDRDRQITLHAVGIIDAEVTDVVPAVRSLLYR